MRHRGRLLEVLHRAETGPMMEEREFELRLVAPTIKRLVKEYGIKFDRSRIVPSDDDLADRIFQAGLALASEIGIFCQSTSRRITWTRAELEAGLRYALGEAVMGDGADAVIARSRLPEDTRPPIISGGAYGVVVPEHLFVPLMLSYAQEPVIDVIDNGNLETAYGYPVKAGSPWEALGGWREAELSMQVVNRAGRPGLCIGCVELSPTALAEISASSWGGFRPTDWHHVATVSEFKTNYDLLSKVVHTTRIGGVMEAYYNPIYGGYAGGAEGVALALTAGPILLNQVYMGTTFSTRPDHPFLNCDTTPELLWAQSVAFQGLSRNSKLLIASLAGPAGGPGTKTMLYENAAFAIATVVSGLAVIEASMSAGGRIPRHASGLDAVIVGEVAHAVRGMSRDQANELVIALLARYEADLAKSPTGRPFEEVYDVETVKPTAEWQGMYDEVRSELVSMGLPLDRVHK
jgi:methylamine---corrinoid protein Co-methyltransferase